MLIVMDAGASAEDIARVVDTVQGLGLQAHPIPGAQRTAIGITGNRGTVDRGAFENLPGVTEVIPVSAPYKLVSREAKRENTVVSVGGVLVGGEKLAVAAGPCAIESEARAVEIGRRVREAGANLYRGGAFKPRTSPYSFQGLGAEGLKILSRVRAETGLPIVTEVLDTETAELVAEHADCLQVGARNMQNFSLLKKLGRIKKPVLLKRGMSATIEELLLSAEYLLAEGQLRRHPLRARHPHVRGPHPQHARPLRRALRPADLPPAHRRRSFARDGQARQGAAALPGRRRGRGRRAAHRSP